MKEKVLSLEKWYFWPILDDPASCGKLVENGAKSAIYSSPQFPVGPINAYWINAHQKAISSKIL